MLKLSKPKQKKKKGYPHIGTFENFISFARGVVVCSLYLAQRGDGSMVGPGGVTSAA